MKAFVSEVTAFEALNGHNYPTLEQAQEKSFGWLVMDCQWQEEHGPTGEFCLPAFLRVLNEQPDVKAYLLAQLRVLPEVAPDLSRENIQKTLIMLSGHKAAGWLGELDGTISAANVLRERVLMDYALNAHEDIDHLADVLKYIAESIKVAEPTIQAPVDPLFGKPFPQLSLEGFVDMANKNGQDIGRESLEALLGRKMFPNSILTKPNLYFLLDHFGLTYDHTKGYEFDFTFGKEPTSLLLLTELANELHVKPLDIIEAGKTFGYDLRTESKLTEYEANAIRAYAKRNWRE